jgi:hypothetical protein
VIVPETIRIIVIVIIVVPRSWGSSLGHTFDRIGTAQPKEKSGNRPASTLGYLAVVFAAKLGSKHEKTERDAKRCKNVEPKEPSLVHARRKGYAARQ